MKLKNILSYFTLFVLFSCLPDIENDNPYVGFEINIINTTSQKLDNLKLHIGGIENNNFMSTDFLELPTIIVRPNESFSQVITFGESRWQTDLEKIFKISHQAYFALEFEDGQFIKVKESFQKDSLISFSVTGRNGVIKNKYGGRLFISIEDDKNINGSFFEDTKFR